MYVKNFLYCPQSIWFGVDIVQHHLSLSTLACLQSVHLFMSVSSKTSASSQPKKRQREKDLRMTFLLKIRLCTLVFLFRKHSFALIIFQTFFPACVALLGTT